MDPSPMNPGLAGPAARADPDLGQGLAVLDLVDRGRVVRALAGPADTRDRADPVDKDRVDKDPADKDPAGLAVLDLVDRADPVDLTDIKARADPVDLVVR